MRPDTSNWRERLSYDFYDALSIEGLAWECLRRDEPYQLLYDSLVKVGSEAEPLPQDAERRWGLRFRSTAGTLRSRPAGTLVAQCQPGRGAAHTVSGSFAASVVPASPRHLHRSR